MKNCYKLIGKGLATSGSGAVGSCGAGGVAANEQRRQFVGHKFKSELMAFEIEMALDIDDKEPQNFNVTGSVRRVAVWAGVLERLAAVAAWLAAG